MKPCSGCYPHVVEADREAEDELAGPGAPDKKVDWVTL